ncbi:MAG: hypothetical protein AVDCRST_MAG26-2989, partial [uncultured Chloroflexia bacterium]
CHAGTRVSHHRFNGIQKVIQSMPTLVCDPLGHHTAPSHWP